MIEICANCKYYKHQSADLGECTRGMTVSMSGKIIYIPVRRNDWCSKFREKKETQS